MSFQIRVLPGTGYRCQPMIASSPDHTSRSQVTSVLLEELPRIEHLCDRTRIVWYPGIIDAGVELDYALKQEEDTVSFVLYRHYRPGGATPGRLCLYPRISSPYYLSGPHLLNQVFLLQTNDLVLMLKNVTSANSPSDVACLPFPPVHRDRRAFCFRQSAALSHTGACGIGPSVRQFKVSKPHRGRTYVEPTSD